MKKFYKIYKVIASICIGAILTINPIDIIAKPITSDEVYYEMKSSEIVTSGLEYEKTSKLTEYGWVDIHVLKMDLHNQYINLDILRSIDKWGARDTLSNLAKQKDSVVAGINASFFDMSKNPTDIIGSEYNYDYSSIKQGYNMTDKGASSIIQLETSEIFIDFFGAFINVKNSNGRELFISGINKIDKFENPIIFNTTALNNTKQIDEMASLYKIVVEDNKVVNVVEPKKSVDIPEDGYVIAINDEIAKYHLPYFEVNEEVSLSIDNNLGRDDIKLVLSGGGKILEDGKVVSTGFIVEPNYRHPRTAVGITKDERYLIAMVVDGRGTSIGATHEEMAEYLKEYGVSDAMHFDGGGSSTILSRSLGSTEVDVVNQPSGGTERKIVNGLGFVTDAPKGNLAEIKLIPSSTRVFENMPIHFEIIGYDQFYNPIEIDESDIFWSNQGVKGIWDGKSFIPTTSGKGKLSCYYGGKVASVNIVSVNKYIDVDIEPKVLQLEPGEVGEFKIIGTDEEGYKSEVSPNSVKYTVEDPNLGYFEDGKFLASKEGISKVRFKINNRELSAYVVVGEEQILANSFEDVKVEKLSYPETVKGDTSINDNIVKDGEYSIKLDYEFQKSTQTQAMYSVLDNVIINDEITKLGLHIYGNNSGLMVKGKITDANGTSTNITFTPEINWTGWKYAEANIPNNLVYPIQLERIYVAALSTISDTSGTIYFDELMQVQAYNLDGLKFDTEELIDDPLIISSLSDVNDNYKLVSIFGSTAGRNRLLDDVILKNVINEMNESDLAIFAGYTDIDENHIQTNSLNWNNEYFIEDYEDFRIISLATGEKGLLKTNASQWEKIEKDLINTVQNNIIILANYAPEDFIDKREGELLHNILKDYKKKTDKNIIYISANGYNFDINFEEGIRYINLNGLWYNVTSDNKLQLNDKFYILNFYINGNKLKYNVVDLYPKVEIYN